MDTSINKYYARLFRELWEKDIKSRGPLERLWVTIGRIIDSLIREFNRGQITLQVMGLAYTTLLSLVPLLAVSFSVLKAFGVYNELEPIMEEFLAPLGQQGQEVQRRILDFVNNLQVGVLGSVGLAMLFYTVISLIQKVEQTFNSIWHVSDGRSLARRFSDYLSVILIGPVLMFSALGLAQTAIDNPLAQRLLALEPFGTILLTLSQLGPYLLISCAFAFLYGFLPNTRVRVVPALIGGFVAGLLWYTIGQFFADFVTTSSRYSAIYTGFAGAVLFVIWLYTSWLIVVMGGQITAYVQNPRLMDPRLKKAFLSNRQWERLALEIITLIASAYYNNEKFWTLNKLQARYHPLPANAIAKIVADLEASKLVVATKDEAAGFLPAMASEKIAIQSVLAAVRGESKNIVAIDLPAVGEIVAQMDAAVAQTLGEMTVKDLIQENKTHVSQN
jgi:membrane protein